MLVRIFVLICTAFLVMPNAEPDRGLHSKYYTTDPVFITRTWQPLAENALDADLGSVRLHLTPLDGLQSIWTALSDFHWLQCLLSHTHAIVEIIPRGHVAVDPSLHVLPPLSAAEAGDGDGNGDGSDATGRQLESIPPYNAAEKMVARANGRFYRTFEYHPSIPDSLRRVASIILLPQEMRFNQSTVSRSPFRFLYAFPHALYIIMTPAIALELVDYLWGDGHIDITDSPSWEPAHRVGRLAKWKERAAKKSYSLRTVDNFNVRWGTSYSVGSRNCQTFTVRLMEFLVEENFGHFFLYDRVSTGYLISGVMLIIVVVTVSFTMALAIGCEAVFARIYPVTPRRRVALPPTAGHTYGSSHAGAAGYGAGYGPVTAPSDHVVVAFEKYD